MTTSTCDLVVDLGAVVGDVETPCECGTPAGKCGAHDEPCDQAAEWIARFAHCMTEDDGGERCRVEVVALCDPCRKGLLECAEEAVKVVCRFMGGRCPGCGGQFAQLSDLVLSLVAL